MFDFSQFESLSKGCRDTIVLDTINEAENRSPCAHSILSIIAQKREIAVAARMTSRPYKWNMCRVEGTSIVTDGDSRTYTGQQVAEIVVQSAKQNIADKLVTYYPLAGDWRDTGIRQLILFVKDNQKYRAYARFQVEAIELRKMSKEEMATWIDITPVAYCTYRSVLKIRLLDTENLPEDFLGNRSGKSVYEVAFTGSSPNLVCI